MKVLADLDDARKVRALAWSALAAGPVMLLCAGTGLVLRYATLLADGKDVARAADSGTGSNLAIFMLLFVFLSMATATRSGATFLRLTGWFVVGLALALGAYAGLLAGAGYPPTPARIEAETTVIFGPVMVLAASYPFWRARRAGRPSA